MIPSDIILSGNIPLTSNGKVDRNSLVELINNKLGNRIEVVSPRNETEEKLLKIWQEVLQKEQIGVKDDFFALGGHSIKAIRLSNEYQKHLSIKVSLKELFKHTSIETHANLIDIRHWIEAGSDQDTEKNENIETFNF